MSAASSSDPVTPAMVEVPFLMSYATRAYIDAAARALGFTREELILELVKIGLSSRRFKRMKPEEAEAEKDA